MISYTTINYSDIYFGAKPTKEELLQNISSKVVVTLMAMINSELSGADGNDEIQSRMTSFITSNFSLGDKGIFVAGLKRFAQRTRTDKIAIWGKIYVLEFLKYEFLNYRDIDSINSTPEEEVRILKAYLLIAEELNEKDREEFEKIRGNIIKDDKYFFEKMVWPFVLKQFNTNNRINPAYQFFKLLAFIKYCITDEQILASFKKFIELNGFEKLRNYLGSIHFLINVTQREINNDTLLKKFSWINADELPKHLNNLSFDVHEFVSNKDKQVDFLGLREKPLYRSKDREFVILDIDYLNNKTYNGPLFDIYYQTGMARNTRFKNFPDFKSHVSANVSENIIFKGIIHKLFYKKHVVINFDDNNKPNYPDCYIRYNNDIFLIEFKDYLFPGKLVDEYSFEKIKSHIDIKFITNQDGNNKGISQIANQLRILNSDKKFEFDDFRNRNITVYPIIVHTNFMYQMPGINYYLEQELKNKIAKDLSNLNIRVERLVLIDLETFFEFLSLRNSSIKMFEILLRRYWYILGERNKRFLTQPHQDNFVRSRASFDEICKTIFQDQMKRGSSVSLMKVYMETIGIKEELLDSF